MYFLITNTTGSAGSLKDSRAPVSKQLPAKGIPIFCDSENASQHQPLPTHEWQSLPVKHIDNVENEKKPGVWSNAKVFNPKHFFFIKKNNYQR